MSVTNLAAALIIVIFVVVVVALTGQFLYVHWRRRSFHRHTSHPPPPPIRSSNQSPTDDAATKELVYFFCLKPHDLSPNKNTGGSSPDDQVVDVFKLLEAIGPATARFLCDIKEEDKDDVKSTPDVDFPNKPATMDVCLPSCLQLAEQPMAEEVDEEVAVTVDRGDGDHMKTEFSTPCDSPSFFTPAGSPARDFMETKFAVPAGNIDE
ncbi:hypothetical protein L6452_09557 [Arctium lappa]|uniref:Uncharacterized protein n=1 Tax=Arctium lappa TaxID=4217 RepID=A0ACB9DKY3_ARCLA|nr:hypothetical protein L6452_09557 [Arctium lappa]